MNFFKRPRFFCSYDNLKLACFWICWVEKKLVKNTIPYCNFVLCIFPICNVQPGLIIGYVSWQKYITIIVVMKLDWVIFKHELVSDIASRKDGFSNPSGTRESLLNLVLLWKKASIIYKLKINFFGARQVFELSSNSQEWLVRTLRNLIFKIDKYFKIFRQSIWSKRIYAAYMKIYVNLTHFHECKKYSIQRLS